MSLTTLTQLLLGREHAIRRVAASWPALALAVLFVLVAGLAREYDGEDLFRYTWHLARPLAASFVTGLLLWGFAIIVDCTLRSRTEPITWPSLPAFLACYWMTAPLGWLYALPFERWMDPVPAVKANMLLLGIVSVWRVALAIRFVEILFGMPRFIAGLTVLCLASVITFFVMVSLGRPLIGIMSGARLPPETELMRDISGSVAGVAFLAAPILFLVLVLTAMVGRRERAARPSAGEPADADDPLPPPLRFVGTSLYLAVAVAILLVACLPWTQPPIRERDRVEADALTGNYGAAYTHMLDRGPDAFPRGWRPPFLHDRFYLEPAASWAAAVATDPRPIWPRPLYLDNLRRVLANDVYTDAPAALSEHAFVAALDGDPHHHHEPSLEVIAQTLLDLPDVLTAPERKAVTNWLDQHALLQPSNSSN